MNDNALVKLDVAQHALAECKTAMEAKQIADAAEAARVYLQRTNASAETVNRATEIRLLAERQMGEFLKAMPKDAGGRPAKTSPAREQVSTPPTLREIGITRKQSATAQKLADIPEPEFRERVAVAKAGGAKLSTAKILAPAAPVRSERFTMPAMGMFIARGAIVELQKIQPKDRERGQALTHVRDWCNEQLKKEK